MAAARQVVEETLDAILHQQMISSSYRVLDRISKHALSVPGTKAAYSAIKAAILDSMCIDKDTLPLQSIIDNLARDFGIKKSMFEEKIASLPQNDASVDSRLQYMMILSVLREHWQNEAYEAVLSELRGLMAKRGCNAALITRDVVNKVLSLQFGPAFSHLVNIYVVRAWGRITGTSIKIRSARLTILNYLVNNLVKALEKGENDAFFIETKQIAPILPPPPGPPRPGLPSRQPPRPGLPPPPPLPPAPR
jgi:hypothetical protein